MTSYADILTAALSLPLADQVRLIDSLSSVVPVDAWTMPSDEWIAEAQRRSAQYDAGELTGATWPEVRARARQKAGLDG